jgi:hypothetical protein
MDESSQSGDLRKVCFLSGSPSARKIMADVRSILSELDVMVWGADDIPTGSNIAKTLTDAVLSADFVCIAISGSKPSLAVMYEAGVAAGSQRPVVVVANARVADNLPTQLISGLIIRYKADSSEFLRENLRAYVQQVQPMAARFEFDWRSGAYIIRSNSFRESRLDTRVEERVAARLEQAGALVSQENRLAQNLRPDIIATFPELGPEFNPIIVEIKSAPTYREHTDVAIKQVRDYLRAADAKLGLIVYDSGQRPVDTILAVHWGYCSCR